MKWDEFMANKEKEAQREIELLSNAQEASANCAQAYLKCIKVLVDNINNDLITRDVLKLMAKQMETALPLDEIK